MWPGKSCNTVMSLSVRNLFVIHYVWQRVPLCWNIWTLALFGNKWHFNTHQFIFHSPVIHRFLSTCTIKTCRQILLSFLYILDYFLHQLGLHMIWTNISIVLLLLSIIWEAVNLELDTDNFTNFLWAIYFISKFY